MTSITTICSVILALMIALSGGADIPAVPETMQVITLRNFEMDADLYGDEMQVSLPMEFQLAGAAGANYADLLFCILNEDETLLPLYGRVRNDELQFAIGDSPRAYALSEAMLREETGFDEEDEAMLESIVGLLASAGEYTDMEIGDAEHFRDTAKVIRILADQKGIAPEEAMIEYDGAEYPGGSMRFTAAQEEIQSLLDNPPAALSEQAHASLANYKATMEAMETMTGQLDILIGGLGDGLQAELNYSDAIDIEIDELEIDGAEYLRVRQVYSVDDTDYDVNYLVYGDRVEMWQTVATEGSEDGVPHGGTTEMRYVGSLSDAGAYEVRFSLGSYAEYSEEYAVESNTIFEITGAETDGLKNISGHIRSTTDITSGEDDIYSSESNMPFSYAESLESDGSKTGHFALALDEGDMMQVSLAFDLNFAEAAYVDAFAGREVVYLDEMGEEIMLALDNEWTEALEAAGTVFEAWVESMADELGLMEPDSGYMVYPDGTIEAVGDVTSDDAGRDSLREFVRGNVLGEEATDADEEYDEWDMDMEENVSYLYSWAEAQEAFVVDLLNFTAPEDMPLRSITAFGEGYIIAEFGGDYDGFMLNVSYHGEGVESFALQDGKLAASEEVRVECWVEDGLVYWLNFDYNDCAYTLSFVGDYTLADAEAILAGFDFA